MNVDERARQRAMNGEVWLRGLFMLLFLVAYNIAEFIIVLLAIFQFVAVLVTGRANEPLLEFGNNLSVYVYEVFQFLTFNSEIRPFPFSPWPEEETGGGIWLAGDGTDDADITDDAEMNGAETEDPADPSDTSG